MRRVRAGECEALIGFIASLNQPGPQHCLHLARSEAGIRADIDKGEIDLTLCFWVAEAGTDWRGAVGVVRDDGRGWLYGPWALGTEGGTDDGAPDASLRAALLGVAMAAPDLMSLQAFTDVRSDSLVAQLAAAGFARRHEVHMMQATSAPLSVAQRQGGDVMVGRATPAETLAMAALHDAVLPQTGLSGLAMLDYASRAGVVLAARSAQGAVLGSLCLAIDPVLREAEVEFLSVWPAARGQGVGRALLWAALHEALVVRHYDAVNLCVEGSNVNALSLYRSVGFETLVTGLKQCWLHDEH